ncbi:MAG: hypothetical protein QOE27_971, partial [Solirubrobacteraceae bacterium]|nr:hypothetical protein [Solirubrobacteraceae bacterium]
MRPRLPVGRVRRPGVDAVEWHSRRGDERRPEGSRVRVIAGRLSTLPAAALGVAVLGYVSIGAGGAGPGLAVLVALALAVGALWLARREPAQAAIADRIAGPALMLLPGALLVYFSFMAGGFFPGPPSLVAVLLGLILAAKLALGTSAGGRGAAAVTTAFAAYAIWVLVSSGWSNSAERSLTEVDLVLVYGLGFALFATSVRGPRDIRWAMGGIAVGSSVVCLGAFLARAAPKLWPIAANLDTPRISYPLTYWNALGFLAALGLIVCVGLTSDDRQSRLVKALSALPVPLLAVTLLLTFSRGAMAAGILGLSAYLLIGHPRSLLGALLVLVPSTGIALTSAYRATSLAHALDGSALQASQGRHVATVVVACAVAAAVARAVLAGIDGPLVRRADRRPMEPRVARRMWAAGIGVTVLLGLALGVPNALGRQYRRFVEGNHGRGHVNLRDRLADPGADGRIDLWRVARGEFDGAPLRGTGAGTFEVTWNVRHPPLNRPVLDAHSIYFENLGELGLVGFGLLACIVLGAVAAIVVRIRGPDRAVYAAVLAVVLAWAFHAGVDWDWEMPAVTLPIFVLAGAAAGRPGPEAARRHRPVLAFVALLATLVPAGVSVSQRHLDGSLAAFVGGDCTAATRAAHQALAPIDVRRGAHEILAYCAAAGHQRALATAEMGRAVDDDPRNWETHYGLAVVTAAGGGDPRPAARAAFALNPSEPVIRTLEAQFSAAGSRARWAEDASS